jgi:hypothetical protein
MDEIIALSGHRDYPDRASFFRGLDNLSAKEYTFGGARGFDTDALEYIARTQPRSLRTVVVPNRLIDQPRYTITITEKYSTRVIELKNTGLDRYMIRNRYMVDRSTHLRAFYDNRGHGGTYNTIEYARSTGKSYDVWPINNLDQDYYMNMSERRFRSEIENWRSHKVNLSAVKGIIMSFFQKKYGMIPRDVIVTLGSWRLVVYW